MVPQGSYCTTLAPAVCRAPRSAARERCDACLGVTAARRGGFGHGAARPLGVGRGRRTALPRAVGLCALAPTARALLRWLSEALRRVLAGWVPLWCMSS